jgi:hypothetical protein
MALKALKERLVEMRIYLERVLSGQYKYNHSIIHNYQVSISYINTAIGYFQSVAKLEG